MASLRYIKHSALILTLLVSIFAFQTVSAESNVIRTRLTVDNASDFVVEPGKTEIFLNAGETVTKHVSVTNRYNRKVTFSIVTEDFVGSEDPNNTVKLLGDEVGPYSLKKFIKPAIKEFTLEFGEKITIPVTVSIPLDAEPRGYYGAVIVSNEPVDENGNINTDALGKTKLVSRVGSLFLVRVNGEGQESGKLEELKVLGPKESFYEKTPKGFEILFRNNGNVHLVPYGKIKINNMFGHTIDEVPVDAYFALPDSLRYREVAWKERFGLGRYTANLSLYRGYGDQYDNATIAFWVLPWKILLGGFVVIFGLIYGAYFVLSRFELKKK